MSSPLLAAALAAHDAGCCVLPPKHDGSKAPWAETWRSYQSRRPSRERLAAAYENGRLHGLGLVCGAISGGVEVLDFDESWVWRAFVELAEDACLVTLVEWVAAGYLEATPSGGIHLLSRCDTISGSVKLAQRPTHPDERTHPHDRLRVLIETRGEGGYCVVAPSGGPVHETGQPYRLLRGGFATIRTITAEQRAEMHRLARALDQVPVSAARPEHRPRLRVPGSPGDDFNKRGDLLPVLQRHGWVVVRTRNGVSYLRRPGKQIGVSATLGFGGSRVFYCFSSSTDFVPNCGYSPFAVYTILEHDGDFAAAARALWLAGFGTSPTWPPPRALDPVIRPLASTHTGGG